MDDGIVDVTPGGITVAVKGQRFFLGFDRYGWFKHATLGELFDCHVDEWGDLEWPELDVSLEYESLVHPGDYPVLMDTGKWLRRRAAKGLGSMKSTAKARASRANGARGGRPRKKPAALAKA